MSPLSVVSLSSSSDTDTGALSVVSVVSVVISTDTDTGIPAQGIIRQASRASLR